MTSAAKPNHVGFLYRPDIDGLRAIAVLAVLAFHAFPRALPGGFAGVDIFFVISGYLISGIILSALANGTFSFADFYARRVRRIFPALALVLAATLVAGWFLLLPPDYRQLGRHVLGGAGFVSNLVLWSEAGYFDQAAALKPLLHLWSLGIEEQFYLVWPLLLWLAWRVAKVLPAVMVTLAISLVAGLWLTRVDSTAAFYLPLTRFWELAAGALLAACAPTANAWFARHSRRHFDAPAIASCIGAGLLAGSLLWLAPDQPFPGWRAMLPVAGSVLLIAAGPMAPVNRFVLSLRPMVWVGLISYPLYLWHWPIIAFQNIFAVAEPSVPMRWLALAISVLLAWGTYRLVEVPVRHGGKSRRMVPGLAGAMAGTAALGLFLVINGGFASRFPGPAAQYADYRYEFREDARAGRCWLNDKHAPDAFGPECVDPDDDHPLLVVWGDSHAARLFPGIRAVAGKTHRLAQFTRDSCPPSAPSTWRNLHRYPNCRLGNAYVMDRIKALQPATVVLFAHWDERFTPEVLERTLVPTIGQLKELGVPQVVVVGPAPKWNKALPAALVDLYQAEGTPTPQRTRFGLVAATSDVEARVREAVERAGQATFVSALSAFCTDQGCLTYVGNDPHMLTTWDYGHLTTPAATLLARKVGVATAAFDPIDGPAAQVGKAAR